MVNRREFLKTSSSWALSGLFAKHLPAHELMGRKGKLSKIGLQLYTVRDLMKADFAGTLEKVAQIGYREVEFAGYYDNSPETVRKLLDRLGLRAPAAHIGIEALRDNFADTLATARVIGHQYIVCPWLAAPERSLEKFKEHAAFFNKIGEACHNAGLQFAYHNHDFEFAASNDTLPYDVLLAQTDSQLVKMEVDLYWIQKGGQEVLNYFAKYPGRFALCHVKDMDAQGEMVEVGAGQIDFAKIFSQSREAGLRNYFVEHDHPQDALQSISTSYQYLNKLRF